MNRKITVLPLLLLLVFNYGKTEAKELVKDLNINGSLSLNWRMVGPREPGFEHQIQNEVFLADTYFGFNGKISEKFPFLLEFQIPTAARGQVSLYRFSTELIYKENFKLELGKFLIPFGHYNELYSADKFLTVTRPLLYASPDSLDLALRLNSPRPPFSSGYTDIGAKASYYPQTNHFWIPSELTAFIVNGLGENGNRLRTFQNTNNLLVKGPPITGVNLDFGHQNNNLADNNNNKAPGGRIVFSLGDLKIPLPFEETKIELNGVRLGASALYGRYDLEEGIAGQDYRIWGTDFIFQYKDFSFSGEYVYSETDFRMAQANTIGNVDFNQSTDNLPSRMEINKGYYLQSTFPISRNPPIGEKAIGILAFNKLERLGPTLLFSNNPNPADQLPIAAFSSSMGHLKTSIYKYTGGANLQITENFMMKAEYSHWQIKVPKVFNAKQTDINQTAISWVFSF